MTRTVTRIIDCRKFAGKAGAETIIKLAMACNDLSLANDAMGAWKNENRKSRKHRVNGACMYFLKLQISHLVEALKILDEVERDPSLMSLLDSCDTQTRESFEWLRGFRKGGHDHRKFQNLAAFIRNNLGFHYLESNELIRRSLSKRVAKHPNSVTAIVRGSEIMEWNFQLADEICDRIVVRECFKIPEPTSQSELRERVDEITMWIHEVMLKFADVAAELTWKFSEGC